MSGFDAEHPSPVPRKAEELAQVSPRNSLPRNMAAKVTGMIQAEAGALELMCGTQDCFT